jgi:hypothetical protein
MPHHDPDAAVPATPAGWSADVARRGSSADGGAVREGNRTVAAGGVTTLLA